MRAGTVVGCVCPHAGWVFSGRTASAAISAAGPAETFVVIGPNHHGTGAGAGLWPGGPWQTPLGPMEIDVDMGEVILKSCQELRADEAPHMREHSIEVQLPLIKKMNPSARLVAISMSDYRPATCDSIGRAVAEAVRSSGRRAVIIASSDMTHFEPKKRAESQDRFAIDAMLALDAGRLFRVVEEKGITMCGLGPVAVLLAAAKDLGAKRAGLISYATSGEVTGDFDSVVAYAGVVVG